MSYSKNSSKNECVQVVVRCRPMNKREMDTGHSKVVDIYPVKGVVEIFNPKDLQKENGKMFTFDAVYDCDCTQQEIYDETVYPLVNAVLDGFNGTIFAYGQTGTGKTYTMEGSKNNDENKGIIPKSFEQIFNHISRSNNMQYLVRASYLEIYQEEIRDLLDKNPKKRYELRENNEMGVYVKDLQSYVCKSVKQIEHIMTVGNQNRTIGATNMNEHSSRSHAVFIITVEMSDTCGENESQVRVGKLNLVDLAGSERQSKTGADGERLKEASKINLSLSALGNVISALVDGKSQYIPYRDSKLTRLLQDSLGGNSKTLMVANIGPASYNYEESLTTLRYANRAKNIKNQPKINEDPKDALLREYQEEIKRLKILLQQKASEGRPTKRKMKDSYQDTVIECLSDDIKQDLAYESSDCASENEQKSEFSSKQKKEINNSEKEYIEELMKRIQSMESKLLRGNMVEHTNEQQKALEARTAEIRERKQREKRMQEILEMKEEMAEGMKGEFTTLQQEVESKKKKLKKLYLKLQNMKQEISDATEEFNKDRRELELIQNEYLKDIKLKILVIDNFVPREERKRLLSRLFHDDEDDVWKVMPDSEPSHYIPFLKSNKFFRRPTSQYSINAVNMGLNNRFKSENIIDFEMETFVRTTRDYEGPTVAPVIKSVLEAALKGEEDIDVDATLALRQPRCISGLKKKVNILPKSQVITNSKISIATPSRAVYPKPRGLVPK
uniref:Kinesin-like protein n=1 Tax=Clastoptera arizonana TaxID=38151 RepID=A0A1B6D848_9HEMI